MDFFDSSINMNPQTDVTGIEQQVQVTPMSSLVANIKSITVYDYLGGLAIFLIFMAIWRMVTQTVEKPQSTRRSDIEFLERIWRMEAAKVKD
jgi:hypothetical protein